MATDIQSMVRLLRSGEVALAGEVGVNPNEALHDPAWQLQLGGS